MRKKAMRNVSIMTELSTQKVALAAIDVLKKRYNTAESDFTSMLRKTVQLGDENRKINSTWGAVSQSYLKSLQAFEQIEKAIKDLGVPMDSQLESIGASVKTRLKAIDKIRSKLDSAQKFLN